MADENATNENPVFAIDKLYIKDASFESPKAPHGFMATEQPKLDLNLNIGANQVGDEAHEVTVSITIEAKIGDDTLFLVELVQAGVFVIKNVPQENLGPLIGIECPTILFPYAREAVSDLTVKGGFQPLMLAPVNFAQLYAEQQAKQQAEKSDA